MNCTHVRNLLPQLLYKELSPVECDQVNGHLIQCPGCKTALASLQDLQGILDGIRPPPASVSVPAVFRQAMEIQGRRARRWRRAAIALAGIAATVLAMILFRLEIRAGSHQLVIQWGNSPAEIERPTNGTTALPGSTNPDYSNFAAKEVELQPLRGVIYELAAGMDQLSREVESRDQRQQQGIIRLQEQVTHLRAIVQRQLATYLADSSNKGDNR